MIRWQKCQKCGEPIRRGVLCKAHIKQAQQERIELGTVCREILAKRAGEMIDMVVAAADPDVAQAITPAGQSLALVAADAVDRLAQAWGCRIGRS